ncbi:hypothetical protein HMPREF1639_07840 [Peptostreptococcus sp. MV1]|uniref:hypothetical protein n=1 Tax=Peptostreptococcus sp. MV1 TaxID=1219626 RepID=UPI00050E7826|nr:hypothetical protein [Peptostreptococcus sp. MV1]KGF10953.1 hypothetical protein HMPREF1639_07875 [Peptostreptococcus sp. MV1]KGF11026.1 hypothetical protein HMPREF1639_07840 [Peptostreptococcus sp. MV1]
MIKDELKKINETVDKIDTSLKNMVPKTQEQQMAGYALVNLSNLVSDPNLRADADEYGLYIYDFLEGENSNSSILGRVNSLSEHLMPYLWITMPVVEKMTERCSKWQTAANLNSLSEFDGLLTKITIGLLTTRAGGSVNIFGHHLRYEKVSGDIKEVTKFTSDEVTLADSTTTYDNLKDYTIYVVSGANTGIYCKSHTIGHNGNTIFVECNPTDILTKIGNLKTY